MNRRFIALALCPALLIGCVNKEAAISIYNRSSLNQFVSAPAEGTVDANSPIYKISSKFIKHAQQGLVYAVRDDANLPRWFNDTETLSSFTDEVRAIYDNCDTAEIVDVSSEGPLYAVIKYVANGATAYAKLEWCKNSGDTYTLCTKSMGGSILVPEGCTLYLNDTILVNEEGTIADHIVKTESGVSGLACYSLQNFPDFRSDSSYSFTLITEDGKSIPLMFNIVNNEELLSNVSGTACLNKIASLILEDFLDCLEGKEDRPNDLHSVEPTVVGKYSYDYKYLKETLSTIRDSYASGSYSMIDSYIHSVNILTTCDLDDRDPTFGLTFNESAVVYVQAKIAVTYNVIKDLSTQQVIGGATAYYPILFKMVYKDGIWVLTEISDIFTGSFIQTAKELHAEAEPLLY